MARCETYSYKTVLYSQSLVHHEKGKNIFMRQRRILSSMRKPSQESPTTPKFLPKTKVRYIILWKKKTYYNPIERSLPWKAWIILWNSIGSWLHSITLENLHLECPSNQPHMWQASSLQWEIVFKVVMIMYFVIGKFNILKIHSIPNLQRHWMKMLADVVPAELWLLVLLSQHCHSLSLPLHISFLSPFCLTESSYCLVWYFLAGLLPVNPEQS